MQVSPWRFSRVRHSDVIVSVYANFNCKITISNMTWRKVEAIFLSEFGQIAINFHQSMDPTHTCNHESASVKFQICFLRLRKRSIYYFIKYWISKQKNHKHIPQNVLLSCKFQVINYCFATPARVGRSILIWPRREHFDDVWTREYSLRNYSFD